LIIAGGGVLYSEASAALLIVRRKQPASPSAKLRRARVRCPTTTRKTSEPWEATGTPGANIFAREADLILGIGTRYSDFTTASKTAFKTRWSASSTSMSANSTLTSTPRSLSPPTVA